jgi:RHS repeat-associated protein
MSLGVLLGALAQAQVTVGRTEGDAGVTATGAARYTIPLSLPPGTNGLAPSLALDYDSRSGNGLLGVGFRISGLSSIRRCGSTLAQDRKLGAVALDWPDRLCLDGQRLRLTAGTYGAAGSQYQTEVETFARVTAIGAAGAGPASFRVERRDGLIYEYGVTADARVESAGSDTPREWALNRIRDRNGNFADFVYAEDTANGAHRPLRIDYAGNLQTGAVPYYSVRFTYEARPDGESPTGFVAGGKVSEPVRLDRIDVVHIASSRVVRGFDLAYGTPGATGRSRLASVQECAGSACLPPTRFTWASGDAGWAGHSPVTLDAAHYAAAIPGDVDGDGFDDLAYHDSAGAQWAILRGGPEGFRAPAVSTGLGADADPSRAIGADLDGNGTRDILIPGSGGYLHWLRRTPSATFAYTTTGTFNPAPPGGLVAADVDGDGRDDLVYVKSAGDAIYWRRNRSLSYLTFAAEAVLWSAPPGLRLATTPFIDTAQRFRSMVRSGDFNGDRRVDLLVLTQEGICSAPSSCTSWLNRWTAFASTGNALVPQHAFDGNAESLLADFNADGLTDIGYWVAGRNWQLLLSTGSRGTRLAGFAGPMATAAPAPPAGGRAMIIDWDADGRMDLLQSGALGELYRCRSTGATLEPCQPAGIASGALPAAPMTLDVNGDGYADVMYPASDVRLHLHHPAPPDLLATATDGLGAQSGFEYASLSNPVVHRVGTTSLYPVRDFPGPGHVVSKLTRASANGLQQETYLYEGAKFHQHGRGFLGFARRTTVPADGRPVRVEDYLQDPAAVERIGVPAQITLQRHAGTPLMRTILEWGQQGLGTGDETRSFAYPAAVTVERFELDGTKVASTVTRSVVDSFGTPLQRQVTTTEHAKGSHPGAQHVETTTLAGVVNDTTNWCLGLPASTQVSRHHSLPGGAQVTRSFAHEWDYARCRATQEVIEPSSTTLRVTTAIAYDAYGNVSATHVTPIGQPTRSTTLEWGDYGRFLRSTTNPEGHVEGRTWDRVSARPMTYTDPNGLVSTQQHDSLGRLSRHIRPDGTSTVFTYALCGAGCAWPAAAFVVGVAERGVGDASVASAETGFDPYGREVYSRREQPGGGHAFRVLRYDARGQLSQESIPASCCVEPAAWVTHAYDELGRRVATERPASAANPAPVATRWRHDGLAVTQTDPLGRSRTRRHDTLGHVLQVVDASEADTDYEYDAFGNLVKVRDFAGAETVVTYDVRGFKRSITDPNAGRWAYDYYPLGELRAQTNARGQVTTFSYDRLSRPVSRTEPEGTTAWTWGTLSSSRSIGSLVAVSSPGFRESYQFDGLGRPVTVTTAIAGTSFVSRQTYHSVTGLPDVLTYPASTGIVPLRVRHHYDRGRLVRLSDADTGAGYWQLDASNAFGQATQETLGNGVRVTSAYDAVTGRLMSRLAGPGGGGAHQDFRYEWDSPGNLTLLEERNRGVQEQFFYDSRDRLDYALRGGKVALDLAYDDLGNATYKSDVGEYRYDASRRQAVVSAGANTYAYDANGAVVNASGTAIGWLSYDLPSQLSHPGGNYAAFYYGADRARYRQVARAGSVLTDTLYAAGGLYERVTAGTATSFRHHIVADGRRIAVHTRQSGGTPTTVYLLEDHLGGVDGFMSSSGALLTRNSYQPFGARRAGDGLASTPTAAEWQQIQKTTARGYTDHEHLDNLGLVHMNGRVYDPVLGRFLSPDPVVQAPYDAQGLNRYAYVLNNPLRYTDPSGFCSSTQSGSDQAAQSCLEQIFVEARRLFPDWQLPWAPIWSAQIGVSGAASQPATPGTATDSGSLGGTAVPSSPDVASPVEPVVTVTASRLSYASNFVAVPALPTWWLYGSATMSSRLLMFGAAGALAGILAAPAEISETSDLLDEQGDPRHVYHFTDNAGKRGISSSGLVLPGGSGLVYVSPIPYGNAAQAQRALSLPRTPAGYFEIPRFNVSGPLRWSVVGPNFGQPGGGMEASVPGAIPLSGAHWVPFGP